uniref:Uncharacterized protein n=1 Tax=Ciona savignyi TaxID=51511 RepID=H2Y548_CIOSA
MSFKRKNTKPTRVPEPMLRYDPMQDNMVQHGALHTGLTNNELCLPPDIHVPNFHPTPPGMKSDSFHHPSLNMLRAAALFPNGQHFPPAITSPCVPEAETMYLGQPPMLHSSNDQHLQGCGTPWQVSLSLGNNSMDPPTMVAPNSRWQTEVSTSRSLNQTHHINAPSRNHPGKWSLSPQPENIEP